MKDLCDGGGDAQGCIVRFKRNSKSFLSAILEINVMGFVLLLRPYGSFIYLFISLYTYLPIYSSTYAAPSFIYLFTHGHHLARL